MAAKIKKMAFYDYGLMIIGFRDYFVFVASDNTS